jgi:hypothetical protein
MTTCASCGGSLKALAKFCSQCGAKVGASSSPLSSGPASSGSAARAALRLQVSAVARTAIGGTLFVLPSRFVGEFSKLLDQHVASPLALVADADPAQLQIKARQAFKRYSASGALKYVCLLGDWSDVAPFRVRNPSPGCRSSDPFCLTDSLYGCSAEYEEDDIFTAIPGVPVGRIPVLDAAVVASALLEAPRQLDPAHAFAFGVTAECWSEATQAIVSRFTETPAKATLIAEPQRRGLAAPGVLASPGWAEEDLRQAVSQASMESGSVLLFNVHGSADVTGWYGQADGPCEPIIMTPDTIPQFNSAVMISEACYGGALGYDEPSIVERFFSNGGKAFVGCSVIAWGTSNDSLCGADWIALHFLKALRQGKPLGEALSHAKLETLQDDPLCDPVAQKTVLSFNLYGAPWHSLKAAAAASVLPQIEARGSMLDRVRSRRNGDDPTDSLAELRQRYQSRLPENSRRFMIERNDALRRISGFQDIQKIEALLAQWAVNLEDCELESLDMGDDFGFVLFGKSNKHSGPPQLFQLVMDSAGAMKKTMTTKG